MSKTVHIEGLKELDDLLSNLPKATSKSVMRKVLREAGEPIAKRARALAPRDEGHLIESIDVSTKLSARQRAQHRKQSEVEMFVGAGSNPQSITQEFGTFKEPAQPFMRPAWDAEKQNALDISANLLWAEIQNAASRMAKRKARKAGK